MSATKYLAALCVLITMAASAGAQEQPRPGGDRGRDRGGDGGDRMAEHRQRMSDRIKEQLGATDAEWQVLQPKVEKVQQLQLAAATRMFGGFGGGRGGPGGGRDGGGGGAPSSDASASPVEQKTRDLRASVENKDAKPEELKAKLAALREAKQKAKVDLTKAQEDLRELLTVRQEAVLVMNSLLD